MHEPLLRFLLPAAMMFLAEMGDKTQLLALAFASRYKPLKVLVGMFFAIFLLNLLAVLCGSIVSRYVGLTVLVQIIATVLFLAFGVISLHPGKPDEAQKDYKSHKGVILTVFLTFFLAELGDKTQLTAISLAVKYPDYPLAVLFGTSTGMFLSDSLGVFVGAVMLKKIPENLIRYIAALAFLLFGLYSAWQVMTTLLWIPFTKSLVIEAALTAVILLCAYRVRRAK